MASSVVNTLWIGDELGPLERACLRSAMRQGHHMRLFTYEYVASIPEGVEIAEAGGVLPAERIIRYDNGSPSLFSNHFRYALQRAGLGMWADTDYYFLKPHQFEEPYVFGWQHNAEINGAVLRIPADAPMLAPLLAAFDATTLPPWASDREHQQVRENEGMSLSKMPWGLTGPRALTWCAEEFDVAHWAQPTAAFYPTDFFDADWIIDPKEQLANMITAESFGVHLWNEKIKNFKNTPAPTGSFLARLQGEGR